MSRKETATKLGAIIVALGASACCWLPLLLVGLGAGATGAGAAFETLRPYLMVLAIVLLATGFYFTYRRKTVCGDDGACTATSGRRAKAALWGITLLAGVSFAFPYWSESRLIRANARAKSAAGAPTLTIPVQGMTCAACAVSVHEAVAGIEGVSAVNVDQSAERVSVWASTRVSPDAVVESIRAAGYRPGVPVLAEPRSGTAYIEVKGMVQQLGIT